MLSAEPKAEADNSYRYIVLKKITTNTPSQGTSIDIVIGNSHALRAQPTDQSVSYLLADNYLICRFR